jgi:hypothetical protein
MEKLFNMVKEIESETFNLYDKLQEIPSNNWKEYREILNRIRYNEAKCNYYKNFLKFESELIYYIV